MFFPRVLESLPPFPRQHPAAFGCTKSYQPIGVTVHTHCIESFEGLLQRCWWGRGCSELWKNPIFPEHPVYNEYLFLQKLNSKLHNFFSSSFFRHPSTFWAHFFFNFSKKSRPEKKSSSDGWRWRLYCRFHRKSRSVYIYFACYVNWMGACTSSSYAHILEMKGHMTSAMRRNSD